jgi:hypothetical protein
MLSASLFPIFPAISGDVLTTAGIGRHPFSVIVKFYEHMIILEYMGFFLQSL